MHIRNQGILLQKAQSRSRENSDGGASQPRLRGGTFTLMVLDVPAEGDPLAGVEAKLRQAPSFFESAPLVLDLQAVGDGGKLDVVDLVARLRDLGLVPVGIQNGSDAQNEQALAAGLCPFPLWRSGRERPAREGRPGKRVAPSDQARPPEPEVSPAMLLTSPVRSGKRVYARGGDLVAAAPVSAGAELIADGHVHVYGPLRGRALAGVHGDESARIFCQSLQAELVSIAGAYRVREDIEDDLIGQAVQISLQDGRLVIEPLVRPLK